MPTAPAALVGRPAPELSLRDQHGRTTSLADLGAGAAAVALVFYPAAFSGICTGELGEIRDNLGMFTERGVRVAGVSCDPVAGLRAWAAAEGYDFPLLSDFWPHGEVSRRYGVFHEGRGFSIRGTFLVDRGGVLRWSVVNGPGEPRSLDAYATAIRAL